MRFSFVGLILSAVVAFAACHEDKSAGPADLAETADLSPTLSTSPSTLCTVPPNECGGDLIGAWRVEAGCTEPSSACSQITTDIDSQFLGFASDGTLTISGTIWLSQAVRATSACFGGAPCADVKRQGWKCTEGEPGFCECVVTLQTQAVSGSYSVSGTGGSIDIGAGPEIFTYCVQGDQLVLNWIEAGVRWSLRRAQGQ